MLIPKGGNIYTASVYMNYVYDPKVAADGRGLRQLHLSGRRARARSCSKSDPAVAKNMLIFPTKKMLDSVKIFDSNALNNQKYLTAWQNLVSG